jgi:hypothetical protein
MFALISKGFEHRSVANVHFVGFQEVSSTSGPRSGLNTTLQTNEQHLQTMVSVVVQAKSE